MSEKPLAVRVAEAIGWLDIHQRGTPGCCGDILLPGIRWAGRKPGNVLVGREGRHDDLPDFDTDWAATGPLIEKYGITLSFEPGVGGAAKAWIAEAEATEWYPCASPLVAVCECVLALHAAGKV